MAYVAKSRKSELIPEESEMAVSGFTRREFTLALAGGTALAADQPLSALAQDVQADKKSSGTAEADKADKEAASSRKESVEAETPEPPPEAAYLIGLIMRRYPDERLDEAAVTGIVRDIYGDLARSRVLGSFPLDNSDEPGFTFKAWRAD